MMRNWPEPTELPNSLVLLSRLFAHNQEQPNDRRHDQSLAACAQG
jgi:hypothetical protein